MRHHRTAKVPHYAAKPTPCWWATGPFQSNQGDIRRRRRQKRDQMQASHLPPAALDSTVSLNHLKYFVCTFDDFLPNRTRHDDATLRCRTGVADTVPMDPKQGSPMCVMPNRLQINGQRSFAAVIAADTPSAPRYRAHVCFALAIRNVFTDSRSRIARSHIGSIVRQLAGALTIFPTHWIYLTFSESSLISDS